MLRKVDATKQALEKLLMKNAGQTARSQCRRSTSYSRKYTLITACAEQGKDPVIDDAEIRRTIQVITPHENNPVLIGEPGVNSYCRRSRATL